jgi:hypothetical protein
MKPIYTIFLFIFLTGCLKANIAPTPFKNTTGTTKADSVNKNIVVTQVAAINAYDWYNGTKGTALIKVTCIDCNAIATIGDATMPFLVNEQGIGLLKYTPVPGLAIRIAVCPVSVKAMKVEILDATNTSLYTYAGVTGNWSDTYTIK